jgi:hypothetical protein
MDSLGNAMAIWQRTNGSTFDVQVSFYNQFANSWSLPVNISPANEQCITPEFFFDGTGNGIAVWNNTTTNKIQSASYTQVGNIWSAVTDISGTFDPKVPHLAVNAAGKAIALWLADTGTNTVVEATIFNGSTWGSPTVISDALLNSVQEFVAIDQAGNGIAIWKDDENDLIKVANYDQTLATWSSVLTISLPTDKSSKPRISIVPSSGNAVAVWRIFDGTLHWAVGATYTFSTSTWSTPTILSIAGESVDNLRVAVDSTGNAVAIWRFFNGSDYVIQTIYYNSTLNSWTGLQNLSLAGIEGAPSLFINTATAVFSAFVTWSYSADDINFIIQAIIGS